jgi:hypothetical protein
LLLTLSAALDVGAAKELSELILCEARAAMKIIVI